MAMIDPIELERIAKDPTVTAMERMKARDLLNQRRVGGSTVDSPLPQLPFVSSGDENRPWFMRNNTNPMDALRRSMASFAPPAAQPFDAMAQPPKTGDLAEFAGRPTVPTPSILDGESRKQAVAVNPAQPMMPPANAIGLNTDADIAEIRARVRQMEGRELPQFKTPNAEADLTERMKNIKVPTRPGLSDLSDDDKSSALLRMGLGMMGGTSPFFAQNFEKGGNAGLDAAEKSRDAMMKDLMTKYGIDADMAMKLVTARSQDTAGANANIAALYNQLNDRDKNALTGMSKVLELRTAADKVKADSANQTRHVDVLKDHYKNLADQMKGKSPEAKAAELRDQFVLITKLKNNTGNPQDVQLGTMMERALHASVPASELTLRLPPPKLVEAEIEDAKGNPKVSAAISMWSRGEITDQEFYGIKGSQSKR